MANFLDRIYKMKTNGSKSNENNSENSVHSVEKSLPQTELTEWTK